jgi:putative nucleotidyltransferase with HDIG domain
LTEATLGPGDVATQDLTAPMEYAYVSEVLTEQARAAAEQRVEPVYGPLDTNIARLQSAQLMTLLDAIREVRGDAEMTMQDKRQALEELPGVSFSEQNIDLILTHATERWDVLANEARVVLERVMRNAIRSEDIETIRSNLPPMVSLSLTVNETDVIVAMVSPMITANSFYSPELTALSRETARNAVEPVVRTFVQGQTVVRRGQVISAADYEALTEMGLIEAGGLSKNLLGAAALVIMALLFMILYFNRRKPFPVSELRSLLLVAILFLIFLYGARLTIPGRTVLPYIFPIPALGLLFSVLFGMESGIIFSLILSLLAAYGMPNTLDLFVYYLMGSLCGVLVLGQARRVSHFLLSALAIGGAGMGVIIAFRIPFWQMDWLGIATLVGASLLVGVASSSLALLLQYILAQWLGLTTALQLLEISRTDSPLLKYFLMRAPGSYQHSLQVANLAEQAAERIGADALLTRVGGLFHDVGKSANPIFFVENQTPGSVDAHDDMDPGEAAKTIIRHVTDGLELARKYRLPRQVQDFISEHHGSLLTRYQFNRALEKANGNATQVNKEDFRYPGPPPRSRETAILMLADGIEARARAERPKTDDELYSLVRSVIENRQREGQLDGTALTQQDLRDIASAFYDFLRGTYHPRIEYPKEQMDVATIPRSSEDKK